MAYHIGVAPEATLHSAVVIDGGPVILRMLRGLCWMAQQPIRVLAIPAGVYGSNPIFQPALRMLLENGILPIAAIGNRGVGQYYVPACYPEALAVGAADDDGQVASFSGSYNHADLAIALKPDLLAPGTRVLSLDHREGTRRLSGTSMACALVAGTAALLWQACPEAAPQDIQAALMQSSRPQHDHRARRGCIDPFQALTLLQTSSIELPQPVDHPPTRYVDPHLRHKLRYARTPIRLLVHAPDCAGLIHTINERTGIEPLGQEIVCAGRIRLLTVALAWATALLETDSPIIISDVDSAAIVF